MPTLYLIPSPLGDVPVEQVLTKDAFALVQSLTYFVVEEVRTARRYLSRLGLKVDTLHFDQLNEHTMEQEVEAFLEPMRQGMDMGLISEAGLPAVADPGAWLVALAHRQGYTVCPLVGPSSLMLALMASGLNGQQFAFNGYLPVKEPDRQRRLRELEKRSKVENQTQLFIETPYRNKALFDSIMASCYENTRLCIAVNLTMPDAWICTRTVAQWKKQQPDFDGKWHKKPCVFLILA